MGLRPVAPAAAAEAAHPAAAPAAVEAPAWRPDWRIAPTGLIGDDPGAGRIRLAGHVPEGLSRASVVEAPSDGLEAMTLTVVLQRSDEAGFQRYLRRVYDPDSPDYRHFLSQSQITKRFGPTADSYHAVRNFLASNGFHVVQGSRNRLTLTVRGTRAAAESAFSVRIRDYRVGGTVVYANDRDPAVPLALAPSVFAIDGLSSLSSPRPATRLVYVHVCHATANGGNGGKKDVKRCVDIAKAVIPFIHDLICGLGPIAASLSAVSPLAAGTGVGITLICNIGDLSNSGGNLYNTLNGTGAASRAHAAGARTKGAPGPSLTPVTGAGQKVGLLEFDTFNRSDVSDYLALIGAPASRINNLTSVPVNGGVSTPGSGESEVLLDIDAVMTLAPAAKVAVYSAPFNGHATSYTALFNAMINDGMDIISNSWASCEDQVSLAEAQSIDSVLQAAAASGISVFNAAGDTGSTCLDGSPNTISVPADSPSATAVGGTSWPQGLGVGKTYGPETWWDGSADQPPTGQSGFGVSRYFARPAYQATLSNSAMRSIPDVVVRADPANGIVICQSDAGGCPSGTLNGGTSLAAPEWAALAALLNDKQGRKFGAMNPALYPLSGSAAFHSAASMNSDFQHVGLGSPNLNVLNRLLSGLSSPGIPDAGASIVLPLAQPGTANVFPDGSFTVPADGAAQGGVLVTLLDANGNIVSGKIVQLAASNGSAVISPASTVSTVANGAAAFLVTDLVAESVTFTPTDVTDGIVLPPVTITFGVPPAASAGINVGPSTVAADGQSAATITVTLVDALNRPTPGKLVAITGGSGRAVITGPTPSVTDANGRIQFSATDLFAESVTFTAVDVTDDSLPVPGSGTVNFSGTTSAACNNNVAPVAGTGYAIAPFATGLPAAPTLFYSNVNFGCPGAVNPAFLPGGSVLIADFLTGGIYRSTLAGGSLSSANILAKQNPTISSLVFGKDGSLYAAGSPGSGGFSNFQIVQLDPSTGAILRVVASGVTCPAGLAVDPLSGDLFFDDDCSGGGSDNPAIFRIIDPANSDPARPTAVVQYATTAATPNAGMAFAPNGTLYVVSGYFNTVNAKVYSVSATNAATMSVTEVAGVTTDFGIAIGATNADGSARTLIVEPAGVLEEVPIANPGAATVIASSSPGLGSTGPDGCLYSARYTTVYRTTRSDGSCGFAPTSPAAQVTLSPGVVSPNPAQGASQSVTAHLKNVASPSGVAVTFVIRGANEQLRVAHADANGDAVLTYVGSLVGTDTIVATATVGGATLASNTATVTWNSGQHVTFMSLNTGVQSGVLGRPGTLTASLFDVSASPDAPVAGQTVTFSLGGTTCNAVTDANGSASCQLTPTQIGSGTVSASFTGTSQLAAATRAQPFNVLQGTTPAPSVTISVDPAAIAVGDTATLTWSSMNADTCAASDAWSGAVATSGTQTLRATAAGTFTYTLTCTGAGGSANGAVILTVTSEKVTVTAKSGGGGAFGWPALALLALIGLLRRGRATALRLCVPAVLVLALCPRPVFADPAGAGGDASGAHIYAGVRVGQLNVNVDEGAIGNRLGALGLTAAEVHVEHAATAGTVYAGISWAPAFGLELSATHRDARVATIDGTISSGGGLPALLEGATGVIRGYGNLYALSYAGRWSLAPRLFLDPRVGVYAWRTEVTASGSGQSASARHGGGGLTAGLGLSYRVWRQLEIGVGVDHYRGNPSNIATLYAGSLAWRW